MRRFDVAAVDLGMDQYWSSLKSSANLVQSQTAEPIDITFSYPRKAYSFESLDEFPTKVGANPAFVEIDTTVYRSAPSSLKLLPVASAQTTLKDGNIPVQPGQRYRFDIYARKTADYNGTQGNSKIRLADSTNNNLIGALSYGAADLVTADTWILRSMFMNIPAGVTQMDVQVIVDYSVGAVWIDDLVISRIDTAPFPVTGNQPISRNSQSSINIGAYTGLLSGLTLNDFSFSMIMKAAPSDMWLMRMTSDYTNSMGVRLRKDGSMELAWPTQVNVNDEDGNITVVRQISTEKILYGEGVSYFTLTRKGGTVTMTFNNQSVTIEGFELPVTEVYFGDGIGQLLIDKIGLSTRGLTIRPALYSTLFISQRLDTIPRPDGNSTFNYLADASKPEVTVLEYSSFYQQDDYSYAVLNNQYSTGVWQVIVRSSFPVEYSTDQGVTWLSAPARFKLGVGVGTLVFRHQGAADENFWIEARLTFNVDVPMSYFDSVTAGDVYLPDEVGYGYYDMDAGDTENASFTIVPLESDYGIRTVEFLGSIDDEANFMWDNGTSKVFYVNGAPRLLNSLVAGQIYHVIAVYSAPIQTVTLNPGTTVGFGASNVAYTQSDAYYIYNVFSGSTVISSLSQITAVKDGVSNLGGAASVLDLQWDR